MAQGRPRCSNPAARTGSRGGRGRGLVTMTLPLPRNVIVKRLVNGQLGFYFNVQSIYRKLGCPIQNEPMGNDYQIACGSDGSGGRAATLNARLDEWHAIRHGLPAAGEKTPIYGTIRWLFQEYRRSAAYL